MDVALNGTTRAIDLGRVHYRAWSGADETRWFANVASAGMSGAIAQRANDTTKALGGKVSYLLATLPCSRAGRWATFASPWTRPSATGRMHDVIVANGPLPRRRDEDLPRGASRTTGVFDVLLIGDLTKRDLMLTLPKTYRGKHLPHPKAEVLAGRRSSPSRLRRSCPSSWTGSSRARRRSGSSSSRARCASASRGTTHGHRFAVCSATCFLRFSGHIVVPSKTARASAETLRLAFSPFPKSAPARFAPTNVALSRVAAASFAWKRFAPSNLALVAIADSGPLRPSARRRSHPTSNRRPSARRRSCPHRRSDPRGASRRRGERAGGRRSGRPACRALPRDAPRRDVRRRSERLRPSHPLGGRS